MPELTWKDYAGESTQELLALANKFRTDSLLCALEEAIQNKEESGAELSQEELVILSVESLEREVNNGGYHQFFLNSSVRFVSHIVPALLQIGDNETAAVTSEAISALALENLTPEGAEDSALNASDELLAVLNACDQRYYADCCPEDKLFAFALANADKINA